MSHETLSVVEVLATVLGVYILLAIGLLRFGTIVTRRFPRLALTRISATVHVLAFLGFLIGCLLAWMAFSADHPSKYRHLLLPIVLPFCVYWAVWMYWGPLRRR